MTRKAHDIFRGEKKVVSLKTPRWRAVVHSVHSWASLHRRIVLLWFAAVAAGGGAVWYLAVTRADVATFYPASCLGGWKNAGNAQGIPDLTRGASSDEFTEANSAIYEGGGASIFCGNFQTETPLKDETVFARATLSFSLAIKPRTATSEELPLILPELPSEQTSSSTEEHPAEPVPSSEESEPTSSIQELPFAESPPFIGVAFWESEAPPPSPQEPSSWLMRFSNGIARFIVSRVNAEEESSTSMLAPKEEVLPEIPLETPSSEEPLPAETIGEQENPSLEPQEQTNAPPTELPGFLKVSYTLDGIVWQVLGYLHETDAAAKQFSVPISDAASLAQFQVGIEGVLTADDQLPVYLDGMRLDVEYETPKEAEEMIRADDLEKLERVEIAPFEVFSGARKSFRADESPVFNLDPQPLIERMSEKLRAEEAAVPPSEPMLTEQEVASTTPTSTPTSTSIFAPTSTSTSSQSSFFNFLLPAFGVKRIYAQDVFASARSAPVRATMVKYEVFDPTGKVLEAVPEVTEANGKFHISVPKPAGEFRPGKYRMRVEILLGNKVYVATEEFVWGVLAVNVNKSIYRAGERAHLQMGVLDELGHTVCDAKLELRIRNQELGNEESILSTEDGSIERSETCEGNNVTNTPDYSAYYTVGGTGIYEMKLVNLGNGYAITDSFEVREEAPFDVERMSATRINPFKAEYLMRIKVTPKNDWSGEVREAVPGSFEITELGAKRLATGEQDWVSDPGEVQNHVWNDGERKIVLWPVSLKAGETVEFAYRYQAPKISPQFYLLGPLAFREGTPLIGMNMNANSREKNTGFFSKIWEGLIGGNSSNNSGQLVFSEARQWQVAADAAKGNARTYYIDTTLASPNQLRTREYASSTGTWGSEVTANQTTNTTINNIVVEAAPTRDEKLIGVWADTATTSQSQLRVFRWDGSTGDETLIFQTTIAADLGLNHRPFDIAYEYLSGDALIVYSNGGTTNEISYLTWNGSATSSVNTQELAGTTAQVRYIELVSRAKSTSDEIAMAYQVNATTNSFNAAVWNGSNWESNPSTPLETGAMDLTATAKSFDIEWEDVSGELLAVWGGGGASNAFRYATSTGSSPRTWGASQTSGAAEEGTLVDLSRRKNTNQIFAVLVSNNGNDTGAAYWSGSAWTLAANLDGTNGDPDVTLGQTAASGWLEAGGNVRAIGVYGDAAASGLDYVMWNGSALSLGADLCTSGPPATIEKQIQIKDNPYNPSSLLVMVKDANADLYSYRVDFNGTSLTCTYLTGAVLNANVGVNTNRSFDFDYDRFVPSITISGTVYSDEGVTTATSSLKLVLDGTDAYTTSTLSDGTFQFNNVTKPATSSIITIFMTNGSSTRSGARVSKYSGTGNVTGMNLYQRRLIVSHEDSGPITNANIAVCDKTHGSACSSSELHFNTSGSDLTVDYDWALYIEKGKTYTPGGAVTLTNGDTPANPGGDLKWGSSTSTLNISNNNLTVGGDWLNGAGGTFTAGSNQNTTFNATTTGFVIVSGGQNFASTTFNGSGGSWSASSTAMTVTGNLLLINGTLDNSAGTANITVNGDVRCSATCGTMNFTASGHTFEQRTAAAQKFGASSTVAWTFVNLTFSASSASTITFDATGTGDTNVTGALTVGGASSPTVTVDFSNRNIILSGSGTPFSITANGIFTPNTSTFNFTNDGAVTVASTTYYNLIFQPTLSAARTYTFQSGPTAVNNIFTINASSSGGNALIVMLGGTLTVSATTTVTRTNSATSNLNTSSTASFAFTSKSLDLQTGGTLTANGSTITLTGDAGTPLGMNGGTFTIGTSTVVFNGNGDITIASTTYYNLTFSPTLASANKTYTGGGTAVVLGALDVNPSGTANSLTYLLGGDLTVSATTTIRRTGGSATSKLDTSGASYRVVSNAIDLQTGGTLTANGSTITLTGDAGTPLGMNGGTFTIGTSTVVFNGNGNITVASTTYYTLILSPLLSASSKTYTAGGAITANELTVNPDASSALGLVFNLGGTTLVTGTTTVMRTNSATSTLSTTGSSHGISSGSFDIRQSGALVLNGSPATSTGAVLIASGGLLQSSSGNFSIGGNYTNNGTFNHNSGTVTLNGTSLQTVSGTLTNGSAFHILAITNNSGSGDPQNNPSVVFTDSVTAATSTINKGSVKVHFAASATSTFTNIFWDGKATTTRVALRSSASGTPWSLVVTGAQTVLNVDAKDSYACGGDTIIATHASNLDSGGNSCWNFAPAESITLTIDPSTLNLPGLIPGAAVFATTSLTVEITGGTAGYSLSVKRDASTSTLASSTLIFPDYTAWNSGTGCSPGQGNGTTTPGANFSFRVRQAGTDSEYCSDWWGANDTDGTAKYAGTPTASETIMNCSTCNSGSTVTMVLYRADAPKDQRLADYTGTITFTALVNP